MSAIEASSVGVKTMADGTLRLSVDIEPMHAQAAFALFGKPGQPLALAALKPASSEPEADKPKGGTLAQWVALRCQEPAFQAWLKDQYLTRWLEAGESDPEECAAAVVRSICGVKTRAELDSNATAAARLHAHIRTPFKEQA